MKLEIVENKESKLLLRNEVAAKLTYTNATPSRAEIAGDLAKQLKCKNELIVINQILTKPGVQEADVYAYIYDNEDALKKITKKGKKELEKEKKAEEAKAKAAEEAKKKAEEAAAAAKEAKEAPKEEASEEAPKEEASEEAPKEEAPAEEKKEEGN